MGDPRVLKPAAAVIKKNLGARGTGMRLGCVLPKAGKRRDGARGSGANVPGSLSVSHLSLPLLSPKRSCQFRATSHPREDSPRKLVRHDERSRRPDRANANVSPPSSCADYVVQS